MVFSLLWIFGFAGITNIAKITELSKSDMMEMCPFISHNELTIYYLSRSYISDKSLESYVQATRLNTTSPFDNITTAPFTNVMSATGWEGPFWVSDDGFRMYFSSDRDGTMDIFVASRASMSVPFSAPTKLAAINIGTANDTNPVLANDEFTIYFTSNRGFPLFYEIYRATRSDTSLPFGAPTLVDEFINSNYYIVDVSFGELEIVLCGTADIRYSHRDSESSPFSSYELVYNFDGSTVITGASLNGVWSKIYYSTFDGLSSFDLYAGDFTLLPTTPTPTPTPVLPTPKPLISIAVNKDEITAFTSAPANPWGGAFDSQGRYIFFDQKSEIPSVGIWGTNRLIRVSFTGDTPFFATIATQTDLATNDSRWNSQMPSIYGVDVLSDDSIILFVAFSPSGMPPYVKILKIVPGATPVITTVAHSDYSTPGALPVCMAVDRTSSPNIIYVAIYNEIDKITADQVNASLAYWTYTSNGGYVYAMTIDENGDIISGGAQISTPFGILRINKNTKEETTIYSGLETLEEHPYATVGLAINPMNQDIFGLNKSGYFYTNTLSAYNIYRLSKGTGGAYTASDYVTGYQVFNDPDVKPYSSYPSQQLVPPGGGFKIDPTASYLFLSNGSAPVGSYFSYPGSQNIIKIGAEATLDAMPHWVIYE
jgi:hypothetical protein